MLILTRHRGEAITVGPDVEITILEVSGDNVRVGISAPRHLRVLRKELREEVEQENRIAVSPSGWSALRGSGSLKPSSLPTR